jgi:hypothetical protein
MCRDAAQTKLLQSDTIGYAKECADVVHAADIVEQSGNRKAGPVVGVRARIVIGNVAHTM